MSERLDARAEVIKLSRVLGVPADELSYLEGLPSADLRAVREQATNRMFDSGAAALRRVAAGAKLLPSALIATIAQKAFGPLLCARAAGAVESRKAIDVAKRLPPDFLADVTIELDPRRVAEIIAEVPETLVIPVAAELGRREEHVTMGRFLAFVPDHAIGAAMGVLSDEAMLRTAFVLEHKDRLDHAIGMLPPDRLGGIVRSASELQLWPEALDLLDHLSEARLVKLASMSPFHDPAVMQDIIWAAADHGLWVDLVPLIEALPADVRLRVVAIAAELDQERLGNVIRDAAAAPHTLPALLAIVSEIGDEGRAPVIAAIDRAERDVAEQLVTALSDPAEIAQLRELATPDVMDAITRAAGRLGMEQVLEDALKAAGEARAG